jgi:hypothetical protein
MTRLERCELLKSKGYTYDPETGFVFNPKGKKLIYKSNNYYEINTKDARVYSHIFAWYFIYGSVVKYIDHINKDKNDNRIINLRSVTNQQNAFNTNAKGYCWDKQTNKWRVKIQLNGKSIHIGRYHTEEESREAYLEAKKKYHII